MQRTFINKIYDKALTIIGDIKVYPAPFWMVYDPSEYHVTGDEMHEILDTIQDGDILLRFYTMYLDGKIISGIFSHAAFYAGNNICYHSIAEGVQKISLLQFLQCDGIAILRFKKINKTQIKKAISNAKTLLGCPYDFEFESNDKKYYCSEFVRVIYEHMKNILQVEPKEIKKFFGLIKKNVILPDAFLNSPALEIVYLNAMAKKKMTKNCKPKEFSISI